MIRAEVSEHDVITAMSALSCTALAAGTGRSEIPHPRHVELRHMRD